MVSKLAFKLNLYRYAAGVKFDGDKGQAAMAIMRQALLDLEERLKKALVGPLYKLNPL
jgi:hypothetical protein